MGKYFIFMALLFFVYEVQPLPLSRLRRLARLRHARQVSEAPETTTEELAPETTAEEVTTEMTTQEIAPEPESTEPPPTTLGFPPSDPNDACHGCPLGEVCREVYPPCARPRRKCDYPDYNPDYNPDNPGYNPDCDNYYNNYSCNPIPICMDP